MTSASSCSLVCRPGFQPSASRQEKLNRGGASGGSRRPSEQPARTSPVVRSDRANPLSPRLLTRLGASSPASSLLFGILRRSAYPAIAIPENARCGRSPMVGRLWRSDEIFGLGSTQWPTLRTSRQIVKCIGQSGLSEIRALPWVGGRNSFSRRIAHAAPGFSIPSLTLSFAAQPEMQAARTSAARTSPFLSCTLNYVPLSRRSLSWSMLPAACTRVCRFRRRGVGYSTFVLIHCSPVPIAACHPCRHVDTPGAAS